MSLATIEEIVIELRAGHMVILIDAENRENEGDLVLASDFITPEAINFMIKHARGLVCLALTEEHCNRLNLPMMSPYNNTQFGTNFTVSIEAAEGITTGISAADRAKTIQVATAKSGTAADIAKPGHIFPLRAQKGGVLMRAGHTEAGCDLTQLAGLTPAAVICEILKDDGTMARLPDLLTFAKIHQLKIGTITDLIYYRSQHENIIERIAERIVYTVHGPFHTIAYRDTLSGSAHLALVHGTININEETLVYVHQSLSVLDFLETKSTSHSWNIISAILAIKASLSGIIILLNCEESAEQIFKKFTILNNINRTKTTQINCMDLRTYGIGAQILKNLGIGKIKLLANEKKIPLIAKFNLEITKYYSNLEVYINNMT